MVQRTLRSARTAAAAATFLLFGACADSDPMVIEEQAATLMVDARTSWAYVALAEPATQVAVEDGASSTAWDIAFNATHVMLNGGAAGPADVEGYCLCQNAAATHAQVQGMTAAGEYADFEAVTLADVPTDPNAFVSDAADLAISGWYAYDVTTHQVSADPTAVWKVRGTGSEPEYAKLRVTQIEDATQAGARVTVEYAVQSGLGAELGPVQTEVLDSRASAAYFDLASGVSAGGNWDLMLDGYDIHVNGDAGAGAVRASDSFETVADASDVPAQVYRGDVFGGVFTSDPWYRYDLDNNHTVFPTYDVYLIRTGDDVFKLQVTGYYNTTGDARWITFRYAPLGS